MEHLVLLLLIFVNGAVDQPRSVVALHAIVIERFKEAIGLDQELADEDGHSYRTLGGLAMKVLGRVPQVGDRFPSGGLQFESSTWTRTVWTNCWSPVSIARAASHQLSGLLLLGQLPAQ